MKKKISKKRLLAKCKKCNQLCCRYITVKISAPRTICEFDGLVWQLAHENVQLFKDTRGWYLLVNNPCTHLNGNGECSIYGNRPITCRNHSDEECEHNSSFEKTALEFFRDYKSLNNFCKKKFKTWDRRF